MSIITISYGGSDLRDNIAKEVGRELGYECHGREVITNASKRFGVPESKLSKVVHYGPSFFGMSVEARQRYTAYILAAAAEFLLKDNIVYHGPAAHVIGTGISHVLKVRVIPNRETRIAYEMETNKLSRRKAIEHVERDEEERRQSIQSAYGVEDTLPELYNVIVDLNAMDMEDAVRTIVETAKDEKFERMAHSHKSAENAELGYRLKAQIVDIDPDADIRCDAGNVTIRTTASAEEREDKIALIRERIDMVEGVHRAEIDAGEDLHEQAAGTKG